MSSLNYYILSKYNTGLSFISLIYITCLFSFEIYNFIVLGLLNNIISINQNCPWSSFEPSTTTFCEEQLCAWITQPANTWSNLIYIFIGFYIIHLAYKEKNNFLALIGYIEVVLGLGSFFFHASSTHLGEVVDVGAMYLFIVFTLVINFNRWLKEKGKGLTKNNQLLLFIIISIISIVVVSVFKGTVGIILFALLAILSGHFETALFKKYRNKYNYKPLLFLLLFFGLAWGIWWLDITKTVCNPKNHFLQGHALWHILNSFCFLFLYKFYKQIILD